MHQPTVRVLEVLRLSAESREGLSLADFSRTLSMPKTTLLPIIRTLCTYGYLTQNSLGLYLPGTAFLSLHTCFSNHFPVMEYIRQQLRGLSEELGETCFFGILEAGSVLYLVKEEAPRPFRVLVSAGRRMPAYATGIGKALLMDTSGTALRQMYPDGLEPLTENTVCDFDALESVLSAARENGFAEETEESMEEVRCFAVPVRKKGQIAAAISVCLPVFRFNEDKKESIVAALQTRADALSCLLEETDAEINSIF